MNLFLVWKDRALSAAYTLGEGGAQWD